MELVYDYVSEERKESDNKINKSFIKTFNKMSFCPTMFLSHAGENCVLTCIVSLYFVKINIKN